MIAIYIDGKALDMGGETVQMKESNCRFAKEIGKTYSQDFEIPATAGNLELLDGWGILSRPEVGGDRKPCLLVQDGAGTDAVLQLLRVTRDTLTVTVYIDTLGEEFRRDIHDILKDDSGSLIGWNASTPYETAGGATMGIYRYNGGNDPERQIANLHPCVLLSEVVGRFETATGWDIRLPDGIEDYYILATRKKVSRAITRGYITGVFGEESELMQVPEVGRCNAYEWEDGVIHILISCKVSISARSVFSAQGLVAVTDSRYPTAWVSWVVPETVQEYALEEPQPRTYEAGDTITVRKNDGGGYFSLVLTFSEWDADSVEVQDLNYCPNVQHTGQDEHPELSISYFGIFENLPDFTMEALLRGLAWQTGKKIKVLGKSVQFVPADEVAEVSAELLSVETSTDLMGRSSVVRYANESGEQRVNVASEWLADEVEVFKNVLASAYQKGRGIGMARVPMYTIEENGAKFEELPGVWLLERQQVLYMEEYIQALTPIPLQSLLGLDGITSVRVLEGETFDPLEGADWIEVEGHRALLVSSTSDGEVTRFTALLV